MPVLIWVRIVAVIASSVVRARQLAPGPHQLLQRHVDQVRRVVLGLGRLPDRLLGDLPYLSRS
ncbi:hypothetical protein [Nonomuraea jabiensis]|uniref:Uncharacterized protein n=1 Tax=Nonomuraea jabiensis TaxID=882448 RepID=A0A7W9GEQ0_9ACTN|nr:hypothetical protein [Nonomuraea jabiensis]MBB5782303.1 hypothetical protein [Nonomuraea jabiensis]